MNQFPVIIIILIFIFIISLSLILNNKEVLNCLKMFQGGNEHPSHREVVITNAIDYEPISYQDELDNKNKTWALKGSQYVNWNSNSQIKTIVNRGNNKEFGRLCQLLTRYFRGSSRCNLISSLKYKSDQEIYTEIYTKADLSDENDERSQGQALEMSRIIKNNLQIDPSSKYLDIGGGDGKITKNIAEFLEISIKNVYCVEIMPRKNDSKDINYYYLRNPQEGVKRGPQENQKPVSKYNLPYKDGEFKFISAIVSLHHIEHLESMISEIQRVLAPGGYLFIKEHDCWNAFDAMLVDIEHSINSICHDKVPLDQSYGGKYICWYKNYYGWDKVLQPLKLIKSNFYYPGLRNEINSTRIFWAIYQKE